MELFIDTADVAEIREAAEMGVIDGVTTNPSLVAKSGRKFMDVLKEIVEIVDGPVSAEVISTDAKGMIKEAEELVKVGDNIVIKIPMIEEGLKAIKELQALNKDKNRATDSMCMLLVVNASSVQLLPLTVIALRSAAGSAAPGEIVLSALLATSVTTAVGITAAKIMGGAKRCRR